VFDGTVRAITRDEAGNTYVGGTFTQELAPTGSGVEVTASGSGTPDPSAFPHVVGKVLAVVSDGSGGWYIGGSFTSVGGLERQGLAHLLSDGSVDPGWNPAPSGYSIASLGSIDASPTVYALSLSGSTLYVGGDFTSIGGQLRGSLAALDARTGGATAWNPSASLEFEGQYGVVKTLQVASSVVYVGGRFAAIGGQPRNGLAAIDPSTGSATPWNPDPGSSGASEVSSLVLSGSTLYVGGSFTSIAGQARSDLAALDADTGAATAWSPNPTGPVDALAVSGSTVYVGGSFTSVGGQSRTALAAVDATSGGATSWNPAPTRFCGTSVTTLMVAASTVYVGGSFTSIGGQPRHDVAALEAGTAAATAWNPNPGDPDPAGCAFLDIPVDTVAVSGSVAYIGGDFAGAGSPIAEIAGVAKITPDGRLDTAFNAHAEGTAIVNALAVSGSTLYVGGQLFTIGGQERLSLAAVETGSGAVTPWNPAPNLTVEALAVSGSTVYVAGTFTSVETNLKPGGTPRKGLAAIEASTGKATSWNPEGSGPGGFVDVDALAISGPDVLAGGRFTSMGGRERNGLAALDQVNGTATAWNPGPSGLGYYAPTVTAIAVTGTTAYLTGNFLAIGGREQSELAAVDLSTGSATGWNPLVTGGGSPDTVSLADGAVYIGGDFNAIGRVYPTSPRIDLAAVDPATGEATDWNPEDDAADQSGYINALLVASGTVYAGGEFEFMGGVETGPVAEISTMTPPQIPEYLSPPVISGGIRQGEILRETHGTWTNAPTAYGYEWLRCDPSAANCAAIAGATSPTYTLSSGDVGSTIRIAETASNAAGSRGAARSSPTAPVQPSEPGNAEGISSSSSAPPSVLPPPVVGKRETVRVLAGKVTIRLNGKGRFTTLSGSASLVDGSEVDATDGRVMVTVATLTHHMASAELYLGRFEIHQDHRPRSDETHFRLSLPLAGCPRVALPRGAAASAKRHGARSRHLWVSEHGGSWGTNGRYVSTTVEGTRWLTQDECDRSEVSVVSGKVKVLDLVRNKTKFLIRGQHYAVKRR
jgi:hypothetical protein